MSARLAIPVPLPVKATASVPARRLWPSVAAPSDDRWEREADRVADRVLRSSAPSRTSPAPAPAEAQCMAPEGPRPASVPAPDGSAGEPLDRETRELMEPRFGHSFARVRVHHDGSAASSASALNARAYTVGPHIVFGAGEYRPHSEPGRWLLAHELTHVLQQRAGAGGVQRSAADSAGSSYAIDDTLGVLRLALRMALTTLGDPALPAGIRSRLQLQFQKLYPVMQRLSEARDRDGEGVEFGFDPSPSLNEIYPGDADRSLEELYSGFLPVPRPTSGGGKPAPPLLQASALPGGLRVTPFSGPGVQRCEFICVGVIILAGLLLAGCRREGERTAEQRTTPCTGAERTEIASLHTVAQGWVNDAVSKLSRYRSGDAAVAAVVSQSLQQNFHTTDPATVTTIEQRLAAAQSMLARSPNEYHCECRGTADAYSLGTQIHLCGVWFSSTDRLRRITTLIHEQAHAAGREGSVPISTGRVEDIYEFHAGYATASPQQAIANADPYAVFARQVFHNGAEGPGTHR